METEPGLEWLLPIWETMTRKVDPFVLPKLFNDPRNTGVLSIYTRECDEAGDTLTNVVQFGAHGKEFVFASGFGLTDGNETFLFNCRIRWISARASTSTIGPRSASTASSVCPAVMVSMLAPEDALLKRSIPDPSNSAAEQKCFIAIGQAKAAGESELLSVGAELVNIGQRIGGFATFTRIDGEESCISRVVEELGKNEWVHLACHGLPDRKQPFESAFALHDGHFAIQRIIGCDLKNPQFAYLSACHTTVGDEESPDEAIHLASAMQFVGFRSVIGTMWAVEDVETNKITSTFYKHMVDESGRLDHTRAAFALNKTMKSVDIPLDQRILYIHLGA